MLILSPIQRLETFSTSINIKAAGSRRLLEFPNFLHFSDGLARAEASRAADAADVGIFCSSGIHHRLCVGVVSDNGAYLHSRCCVNFSDYSSQLAILQLPPSQLVGPK